MAIFEYTAKNSAGEVFAGTCKEVDNIASLREELAKMGDSLIRARRKHLAPLRKGTVKPGQVVSFTYKLAGMVGAGLSVTRSLESLEEQAETATIREMIADIRQRVEGGSTLKEAFERYRVVFSPFFLGMIEAGESSGKLSETLQMCAEYLEKQADLRHKVKSAFAYPVIVGVLSLLVVSALIIFVVPIFAKMYQQLHARLPMPTQILIMISQVGREWGWLIMLLTAAALVAVTRLAGTAAVRKKIDRIKLRLPLTGELNRMIVVSNYVRTFAMLAGTGVTYLKAMQVAEMVADNAVMEQVSQELQQGVETGQSIGGLMKRHSLFQPSIVQMAASGEESGSLSDMLLKAVGFLDKDIQRRIETLLVILEPAMTVIMGLLIGFILMGVYLPMIEYISLIK